MDIKEIRENRRKLIRDGKADVDKALKNMQAEVYKIAMRVYKKYGIK